MLYDDRKYYILVIYFYDEKKVKKILYPQKRFGNISVENIRLSHILHKTLSRPLFKNVWVLKRVHLD